MVKNRSINKYWTNSRHMEEKGLLWKVSAKFSCKILSACISYQKSEEKIK